jgi:hypothetical protein
MKRILRVSVIGLCVMTSCLYAEAQRGRGASRFEQLLTDVRQAAPRATLTDDQKTKLQNDMDGIKSALQAGQQGEPVDRQKITSFVADMKTLVDSGAFAKDDQTALDKEFASLQQR